MLSNFGQQVVKPKQSKWRLAGNVARRNDTQMDKNINRMAAEVGKNEREEGKKGDGEIILQLSLVRHG